MQWQNNGVDTMKCNTVCLFNEGGECNDDIDFYHSSNGDRCCRYDPQAFPGDPETYYIDLEKRVAKARKLIAEAFVNLKVLRGEK